VRSLSVFFPILYNQYFEFFPEETAFSSLYFFLVKLDLPFVTYHL